MNPAAARAAKTAAIILAALLVLGHVHVAVPLAQQPVPALVLVAVAEAVVIGVLGVAITLAARVRPWGSTACG